MQYKTNFKSLKSSNRSKLFWVFLFRGLLDISPEEMRSEAYKSNSGGNAAKYVR